MHRSTQRKVPRGADDEQALTDDIIALARQYGRYGYRRVTALLRHSFASVANELGFTEPTIAALIGHSVGSITGRYIHHLDQTLLAAADRVAIQIDRMLSSEIQSASVTYLNSRADLSALN